MKLQNGFWEDENHNKWSAVLYSDVEAEMYSKTLVDCSYCRDCSYCNMCIDCNDCNNCTDCISCTNCNYCIACRHCYNCNDCTSCFYCRHCSRCVDCRHCNRFEDNPQRVIGKRIGSRKDNPIVYWLEAGKEQCVVGCFRGTLNDLERAVEKTHKDNPEYLEQYRKFIKAVRAYQGVMK